MPAVLASVAWALVRLNWTAESAVLVAAVLAVVTLRAEPVVRDVAV